MKNHNSNGAAFAASDMSEINDHLEQPGLNISSASSSSLADSPRLVSQELARPSMSLSSRPHLGIQTQGRLRARSVNSGNGGTTPIMVVPQCSQNNMTSSAKSAPKHAYGSPSLPNSDQFLSTSITTVDRLPTAGYIPRSLSSRTGPEGTERISIYNSPEEFLSTSMSRNGSSASSSSLNPARAGLPTRPTIRPRRSTNPLDGDFDLRRLRSAEPKSGNDGTSNVTAQGGRKRGDSASSVLTPTVERSSFEEVDTETISSNFGGPYAHAIGKGSRERGSSGSTESDETGDISSEDSNPPATPIDHVHTMNISRKEYGSVDTEDKGLEDDGNGWWNPYSVKNHNRGSGKLQSGAKDNARFEIRRGRSFTSLLVTPITPGTTTPVGVGGGTGLAMIHEKEDPFDQLSSTSINSPSVQSTEPPIALIHNVKKSLKDFIPQLALLVFLFFSSFAVIAFLISTLPGLLIPHSVTDLPSLTSSLQTYRTGSFLHELHLFAVLTMLFLWKQCFSIPGSILTNILFGALYGTTMGTLWACFWTALGSTGAYGIAVVVEPLVQHYFAKPLEMTRRALKLSSPTITSANTISVPSTASSSSASTVTAVLTEKTTSNGDLFSHLLLARFFPLLPYSVMNVIAGVLHLPLGIFFITLVIGSFPFNFVTVSIGSVVAVAASDPSTPLTDKIWSTDVLIKLIAVTIVSVVPLLFKERIKRFLSGTSQVSEFASDDTSLHSPKLKEWATGFLILLGTLIERASNQGRLMWDRTVNAIVRRIFGFGILTGGHHIYSGDLQSISTSKGEYQLVPTMASNASQNNRLQPGATPEMSQEELGPGRQARKHPSNNKKRDWRRQWNQSFGGVSTAFGNSGVFSMIGKGVSHSGMSASNAYPTENRNFHRNRDRSGSSNESGLLNGMTLTYEAEGSGDEGTEDVSYEKAFWDGSSGKTMRKNSDQYA